MQKAAALKGGSFAKGQEKSGGSLPKQEPKSGGRVWCTAAALRRRGGFALPWRGQIRPKAGGQEPKKRGFCGYGGSVAAGYQKRGAEP
jgi:hypothetical protein